MGNIGVIAELEEMERVRRYLQGCLKEAGEAI